GGANSLVAGGRVSCGGGVVVGLGLGRRGPSGWATAGTRVYAIRLPGGAARVRLARLARPFGPGQGCRDLDLAPPGGRSPAPGQGPAAVEGRPGGAGRAGPAAARQPAPPAVP